MMMGVRVASASAGEVVYIFNELEVLGNAIAEMAKRVSDECLDSTITATMIAAQGQIQQMMAKANEFEQDMVGVYRLVFAAEQRQLSAGFGMVDVSLPAMCSFVLTYPFGFNCCTMAIADIADSLDSIADAMSTAYDVVLPTVYAVAGVALGVTLLLAIGAYAAAIYQRR
jgi:hypothetical protein